jgi:hypothetical protein
MISQPFADCCVATIIQHLERDVLEAGRTLDELEGVVADAVPEECVVRRRDAGVELKAHVPVVVVG